MSDSLPPQSEAAQNQPQPAQRWPAWLSSPAAVEAAILFLAFSAVIMILTRTPVDPDLWGHLRFGLDTLQAGEILRSDPYAYTTAGQVWINHEWLAEVIFGLAWNLAGPSGLILLKIIVWTLTLMAPTGYLMSSGLSGLRAAILMLGSFLLLLLAAGTVRPQMFTGLGMALTLLAIARAEDGKPGSLWLLPVVFGLWVNLHGGILAGMLFLIFWSTLFLLARPTAWKLLLPPVLLSLLATLLNPYGPNLLIFLWKTASVARPEIVEWQPLPILTITGATYLLMTIILLAALYRSRLALGPARLGLLGICAVLPLVAQRHVLLYALAAPLLAGPALQLAWPGKPGGTRLPRRAAAWLSTVSILAGLVFLGLASTSLERIEILPKFGYPTQAVSLLRESGASGNLVVYFNWGEYAIWHLYPQIKVSMDGRRETIYSDQVYRENNRFIAGVTGWEAILENYPSHLALVPRASPSDSLLRLQATWNLVYQDEVSSLFVRRGAPAEARLQAATGVWIPPQPDVSFP